MMGISVLIIGAIYLFVWREKGGDWIVLFLRFFFRMSRDDAVSFYFYNFRSNSELIFLVAVAVIFIILLRFSLKQFTRYFDSINNGISALIEGDGSNIVLQHGGKIYAESDTQCTTFTVELPAIPDLVNKNNYGGI
jgi:two-component system sensor histidine kinase VanS